MSTTRFLLYSGSNTFLCPSILMTGCVFFGARSTRQLIRAFDNMDQALTNLKDLKSSVYVLDDAQDSCIVSVKEYWVIASDWNEEDKKWQMNYDYPTQISDIHPAFWNAENEAGFECKHNEDGSWIMARPQMFDAMDSLANKKELPVS